MHYRLHEIDLGRLPEPFFLDQGEAGIGVVFRDRGRIVGFKMVDRADLGATAEVDPAALVDDEVRIAMGIARLRDELGTPSAAEGPTLTVAICSKDGAARVARLLQSLEPLRRTARFEVLVVDNASSDNSLRLVCSAHAWVRYMVEPLAGLNFARNRAVEEAKGTIVAFLDDDVVVDPRWLHGVQRAWRENPDAGCVTGPVLPLALDTEAQILFEKAGGFRRGFRPIRYGGDRYDAAFYPCSAGQFGAGANMSLRRELVLALGGFDDALDTGKPLPGGGDLDIFYRVVRSGATLAYEPEAAVYHEHRRELEALRRQYYTWGTGFMAYVAKSMRSDPARAGQFRALIIYWFCWQMKRMAKQLAGREATPLSMILGEVWGGVVGICGEYDRSRRRVALLRAETAGAERKELCR